MTEEQATPKVQVEFKSSSTKGGGEGYRCSVTSDATEEDVDRTVALAMRGREAAWTILGGKPEPPDSDGEERHIKHFTAGGTNKEVRGQ